MSSRTTTRRAEMHDGVTARLAQMFKILADETRLRILHYLASQGEQNVRALCTHLEQSQPAVSHHLALLRSAGMIDLRRAGKHNYYRITAPWLATLLEQASRLTESTAEADAPAPHPAANDAPRRHVATPQDDLQMPDYDAEPSPALEAETEPAELLV